MSNKSIESIRLFQLTLDNTIQHAISINPFHVAWVCVALPGLLDAAMLFEAVMVLPEFINTSMPYG
ncbi:hypothetical protein [Pusillimonas sp. ANT_WB101]|uniref:hypothetical protein n=1 Tax=Pusillimonas sp. ANT_WB101 TaxID=2597356 RepID=UPI0011EFE0B4|nr:hypothetical protein [Pusillimonas sp. ANT_WB101]KAA0911166.1 hypothetical protein FQ179_04760 [Pusillimonas sp. ANT_WB101]